MLGLPFCCRVNVLLWCLGLETLVGVGAATERKDLSWKHAKHGEVLRQDAAASAGPREGL